MLGWGPASFIALFVLSLSRLVMRASSGSSCSVGLRIEGRPTEEYVSGKTGGGLGGLAVMVTRVFPVIFLRPARARGRLERLGIPLAPNI